MMKIKLINETLSLICILSASSHMLNQHLLENVSTDFGGNVNIIVCYPWNFEYKKIF